jgi:hypothetical protein
MRLIVRFLHLCRIIWREQKAVAIIETAFALPLILLVGLGGIELAYLVLTHSRISQAALGVADNASRIGGITGLVTDADIVEVFTGAALQTPGMDWKNDGRIILSSLEEKTVNKTSQQYLGWSRCFGGLVDGVQPMTVSSSNGMGSAGHTIKASSGTAVMFVEVFYNHKPIVMPDLFGTRRIHYTAAFNVREARDLTKGAGTAGDDTKCTP